MTLAEKIRVARDEADLTQQQLARKVGASRRAVGMWEHGERVPGFYALARISDATGKPVVCTELGYDVSLEAARRPWASGRTRVDERDAARASRRRRFRRRRDAR